MFPMALLGPVWARLRQITDCECMQMFEKLGELELINVDHLEYP